MMLAHQVDTDQLSRRSKGTPWRWDKVEAWLDAEGGTTAPRTMCVLAGAGTGKSTISAAIWTQASGKGRGRRDLVGGREVPAAGHDDTAA